MKRPLTIFAATALGCVGWLVFFHLACSAPWNPPLSPAPSTAPGIVKDPPRSLSPLKTGTWSYNVIDGDSKGQTITQAVASAPSDATAPWRRAFSLDHVIAHLRQEPDGAIVMTANELLDHDVVNTFDPPLTILPARKSLNAPVHMVSNVITRLRSGLNIQIDHGTAELTLTPLGGEKIVTPAGTFGCYKFQLQLYLKFGLGEVQSVATFDYADGVGLIAESDYQKAASLFGSTTSARKFVLLAYPH